MKIIKIKSIRREKERKEQCPMNVQLITSTRILLKKLIDAHLVKKFPTFHGTQRLNTLFTRTIRWCLL
jgi:hypothetical protein